MPATTPGLLREAATPRPPRQQRPRLRLGARLSDIRILGSGLPGAGRPAGGLPGNGMSGKRGLWILALVSALVLAPAAWVLLKPETDTLAAAERYPGTAPGEWGPGATWASPALLEGTRPVMVGERDIALVTADRRLLMVGAADGAVRWEAPLPEGKIRTPPAPSKIAGKDMLTAHIGDQLLWWSLQDGDADDVDLPAGSTLSLIGESPLAQVGTQEVMAVTDDRPRSVRLPENTKGLAAHEDGTITAAGPAGWWHLAPDGSVGSHGGWENTSSATPTVAGYAGGFVLLVRPGEPATLEIHADRTSDVRYVTGAPIVLPAGVGGAVSWHAAPSATWGILGRTLVDLRAGTITDLGAWSTRTVTTDRAYGHIDGQSVVVGPAIPRGVLANGEAMPDVVTAAGAVVRGPSTDPDESAASSGPGPRRRDDVAYFLPPRRTAS